MRKQLALGTLVLGTLDIGEVIVFYGLKGVSPVRIFQSVATGLLGQDAFKGGIPTALLGAVLHYFIAFCVVLTYFFLATKIRALAEHPLLCGPIYGLGVYVVMNYIVLPLSANGGGAPKKWPNLVNQLFAHIVCVGLPAAWFGSRAVKLGSHLENQLNAPLS